MKRKNKRNLYFSIIGLAVLAFFIFLFFQKTEKNIANEPLEQNAAPAVDKTKISPLSGLLCENYQRRPIAVMLAGDNVARPLSGLSEADLVFEMPVINNEITRLMAIYVCNEPKEIGSIRSARDDFIPLALGLDAIYAHWGGSHFAYALLNKKIIDNLDALPNLYNAFYRKTNLPAPHNGFSAISRLMDSSRRLGYRLENKFEGYLHENPNDRIQKSNTRGILKIDYPSPYNVEYRYEPEKNLYFRLRDNRPEIDKNNNQQIAAANVVVMRAESRQIEGQYNTVQIEGKGQAAIYQNGQEIKANWQKDKTNQKSKLYFFDTDKQEIKFVAGQIWIEIIEPDKEVQWSKE